MLIAARYCLVGGWALGMMVMGLALWVEVHAVAGLVMIAGGQFVLMWQVADPLLPKRKVWMTAFMETMVGVLFVLSLAAVLLLMVQNRHLIGF